MDHIGIDLHKRESQICLPADGGEVRVGDDNGVAERLQTPGDPFTLRRGFQEDLGRRPPAECLDEPLGFGADPPFNQFAALGQDADLAFLLVQIDANMVIAGPLLLAPQSA